ncbi:MAG: CBS domain-containing protein [Gammaproteobacteria bacterium]|nr:CBS domain-containing protein [Gammaproteobacteria bacterium]
MITVEELMATEILTVGPDESAHAAHELMTANQIRHLPVIDDSGVLVGLITERDLLAASVSVLADLSLQERDEVEAGIPVKAVMSTELVYADLATSLTEAAGYLLKSPHGCLPVLDNGALKGIITETDFVAMTARILDAMGRGNKA